MTTEAFVLVTGNTFPVKDQIKALGARWDAVAKGWRVPASRAAEAQALVTGAGPKSPRPASSGGSGGGGGYRRAWRPCGYPGCNPRYCDECDGKGGGDGRYGY